MNFRTNLNALLAAQFLTAFADNAILFTAIAMVQQSNAIESWYIPALQASFLLAYVVLAPWVGPLADRHSKPFVLIVGNLIKAVGVTTIFFGLEPLVAYAIVGLGAAIYSPAKYGILPEIVGQDNLVKANSLIEASTIAAIILGPIAGGYLADYNISMALGLVGSLYLVSAMVSLLIKNISAVGGSCQHALINFRNMGSSLLQTPHARFALLGACLFWAASAVVRVAIVAWAPLVLSTTSASELAELTVFLALGVIFGSVLVIKIIPLEKLKRIQIPGYLMGLFILLFANSENYWSAQTTLLLLGIAGGMLIVPVNAALQNIGYHSIGSGKVIAIQNFAQNLAMLLSVGLYALVISKGVTPVSCLTVIGAMVILGVYFLSRKLSPRSSQIAK